MQPSGLLITRPQPEAGLLAQRLANQSLHSWVVPTLDIHPIPPTPDSLKLAHQAHYWIFISANAVREGWPHLFNLKASPPPLMAVGAATAQRLVTLTGCAVLHPSDGADSDALLRLPELQQIRGQRVAIVRGEGGREQLSQALRARGAEVTYVECYRRQCPQQLGPSYDDALNANAWINIQSREALLNLWSLSSDSQRESLRSRHFVVNHPHIAELLQQLELPDFTLLTPGDDALIQHLFPKSSLTHD